MARSFFFRSSLLIVGLVLLSSVVCHAQPNADYPDPEDNTTPMDMGVPADEDLENYEDPNAFTEGGEIPPTEAFPGENGVPGENAQTPDPFLPPDDAYLNNDPEPADVAAPEDIPPTETTAAVPPEDLPTETTTAPETTIPADQIPPADEPQPTSAFAPEDIPPTDANFDPDAATPVETSAAVDDTVTAGNGTMYDFQGAYDKMKGGDLSTEAIIGIVAGVAAGMVLVLCCTCICWVRQRNIWRAKYGDGNAGAIEM